MCFDSHDRRHPTMAHTVAAAETDVSKMSQPLRRKQLDHTYRYPLMQLTDNDIGLLVLSSSDVSLADEFSNVKELGTGKQSDREQ